MVHGVLVGEVEIANLADVVVGVFNRGIEVAVGRHVPGVETQRFEGVVVDGPFEDTVVVIVPVVHVKDTVVVVVVRVRAVATVEPLKQVVNAVVVVIEIVEVIDPVVVVVACLRLFEERCISRQDKFEHRNVDDDAGTDARVGPHQVGQGFVAKQHTAVVAALPAALAALVGGLGKAETKATAGHEPGFALRSVLLEDALNQRQQTAGQHQKHQRESQREFTSLLRLFEFCRFQHTSTSWTLFHLDTLFQRAPSAGGFRITKVYAYHAPYRPPPACEGPGAAAAARPHSTLNENGKGHLGALTPKRLLYPIGDRFVDRQCTFERQASKMSRMPSLSSSSSSWSSVPSLSASN